MNKHKQSKKETAPVAAESYTLSRFGDPDGKFNPWYIAAVRGVEFVVGQFATREQAVAAVNANLTDYLSRLESKPAYRVEEVGTVTVDTGTIIILDPCRIGRIATTQNDDDLLGSPLYPHNFLEPTKRLDDANLAQQIVDPPVAAKENPKASKDYGTRGGNALSLKTGLGDGEYTAVAEIGDFGEPFGERIASIHIQFLATEDIEAARNKERSRGAEQ